MRSHDFDRIPIWVLPFEIPIGRKDVQAADGSHAAADPQLRLFSSVPDAVHRTAHSEGTGSILSDGTRRIFFRLLH